MARRKSRYSGIGGQAVLEGVMMKNKEKYAVAVRKPDGEIEVEVETYQGLAHGSKFKELPFIRGIFNFLDSLILGTRALNYSASFYEEEEGKETKFDKAMDKMSGGNGEKLLSGIVTVISIMLAVGIFIVLPYFISSLFDSFIRNRSLMAIIEGVIRIALFLLYVWGISAMKEKLRTLLMGLNNIPLLNADIVTGISLMLLFIYAKMKFGLSTLILAHITFNVPYVILNVLPRLRQRTIPTRRRSTWERLRPTLSSRWCCRTSCRV